jgi:fatty acid desaturase
MHGRPNGRWVRVLELLAGYPITTTLAAMRYHHLRHHRHNGTLLDPYFRAGASHRLWPATLARLRGLVVPIAWIVRAYVGCLALRWPGLRNGYGRIFLGERSRTDLREHREIAECLRAEPGQALFFVALVPIAVAFPAAFVVGYALPLLLAGLCNANRVVAEHEHILGIDHSEAGIVATTRTHRGGLWTRLVLFPRHIGLHTMHHLHPRASNGSLPALQRWYEARWAERAEAAKADASDPTDASLSGAGPNPDRLGAPS